MADTPMRRPRFNLYYLFEEDARQHPMPDVLAQALRQAISERLGEE
jgi:hypothetical protein